MRSSETEFIMGNRKGRVRRNKKPNNWKAMCNKRKMQNDLSNVEFDGRDTLGTVPENQSIFEENEEFQEFGVKRRRMSNGEENIQVVKEKYESYYAVLEDIDEDDNGYVNEYETQPSDPLLISDDEQDADTDDDEEGWMRKSRESFSDDVEDGDIRENDVHEGNSDEGINDQSESDSEGDYLSNSDDEDPDEPKLTGRRIWLANLFNRIKRIGKHSKNCHFEDMVLLGEIKKGLNSVYKFQCKKCGTLRNLESCPKKRNSLGVNEQGVLGICSIGSGFYHLQEFLAQLDITCMGASTYNKISKNQQNDWYTLAKQSAREALEEEIKLAIAAGEIDSKGNALISVICDGGWGKRSYGKKFNSLSGCAVLVGVRTKKVLFFGVRNKYCHTCKIAQSKCTPVNEHECNINYRGPSSGMEADIILEGFKECEELGARFHKLIADGDSSTYKVLRDIRIYKNPDLVIEKLECVNHLCRNFRSRFGFLEKVTRFNKKLRKHVKPSKADDICKGVKSAAKYWRESESSLSQKISGLEQDIMNAPAHYFGVHTKCKSYFCIKTTSRAAIDNLSLLKTDGLYYEVLNLCQVYFAGNAKSLLENQTNNAAEEFNNIVAKYLGGKRINYSLARAYTGRVAFAVVQYNSEGHACSSFRNFKLGIDDPSNALTLENSRRRKLVANATALRAKPRDRHPKESHTANGYFHGFGSEDVDMSPDNFEKCKKIFLEKIKKRQKNRNAVERKTVDAKFNSYWHEIRQDLLPSSHFYRIINATKRESYTNILQEIMYNRSEFGNNAQIKHQRLAQRDALSVFEDLFPEPLKECGIFIDKKLPFLCASPFRLYGKDSILSIKCPVKEYMKKFEQVIPKIKFLKKKGNDISINEKSDWYLEIQGDLRVTGRKLAFIMIWLGEDNYRIYEIERKDTFFKEKMEEKLTFFYKECMLKELVDSRVGRFMKLRTYDPNTSTFV